MVANGYSRKLDEDSDIPYTDSPPPSYELIDNPFQGAIGSTLPSLSGRVTRSRSTTIPVLQNLNNDFQDDIESGLQTAARLLTSPPAHPLESFRAPGNTSISGILEAEETETRFTFKDLIKIVDLLAAKINPTPLLLPLQQPSITSLSSAKTSTQTLMAFPRSEYTDTTTAQFKICRSFQTLGRTTAKTWKHSWLPLANVIFSH